MRSRLPFVLPLLAASALAACAGLARVQPLREARSQDLRYVVEMTSPELRVEARGLAEETEDAAQRFTVRVRVYGLDPRLAAQALGPAGQGLVGRVAARAEVLRLEEELVAAGADQLQAPTLTVAEGRTGSLSLEKELAYVSAFEVESRGETSIADPRVDVAREGLALAARPTLEGEAVRLDLELVSTELERPLGQRQVDVAGSGLPVEIQVPLAITRTLATEAVLRRDEALVLGGASFPIGARAALVVVEAEPAGS